jgi:hypothetical protein
LRIAFPTLVGLHGLIHLVGPANAFGWVDVEQIHTPISATVGVVWLAVAVLFALTAVALLVGATWWWYPALPGILASQALIVMTWSDAKFGTIVNLTIAVPVFITAMDGRPSSFRNCFARDRQMLLQRTARQERLVTEADLAPLPVLLQTYLRRVGVVGRPRVHNLCVGFTATMRSSETSPWMKATATQSEFVDPPARLFLMNAHRAGVPLNVFHRYVGGAATFGVRVAGLVPVVDKKGPDLTNDETVTLMNDVLVLAPAAVLDTPFTFTTTGERTLRATFRNAGFTVSAAVTFDDAGDLVGFVSGDRAHGREGGAAEWSTPISDYRVVDGIRVGTRGDTNWIERSGEWTYGRFEITSLAYNVVG